MLKKILFVIIGLVLSGMLYAQSGTIKGKITDKDGETVPFANVIVEKDGVMVTGVATDFDGNYTLKPIPIGSSLVVKVSCLNFHDKMIKGVLVNNDKVTFVDIELTSSTVKLEGVTVTAKYKVPLFEKDAGSSGQTVGAKEITRMSGRGVDAVTATTPGVTESGTMRGGRSDANIVIIDGMRVSSSSIPQAAIEQISVIMGGIPAKYGDVTGGVTEISLRGISNKTFGSVELVTSQFLDNYGDNLLTATVSGPIFSKPDPRDTTRKKAVVGYFLAAEGNYIQDAGPVATDIYKIKDGAYNDIINSPLRKSDVPGATYYSTDFLRNDKFETVDSYDNNNYKNFNLSGKLDFNVTDLAKLTIGGKFRYYNYKDNGFRNSLLNSENVGVTTGTSWRAYAKFTHSFADNKTEIDTSEKSASLIKNAFYTLNFSFEQSNSKSEDETHRDNFFDYGYVGKFNFKAKRAYNTDTGTPNIIDTINGVPTEGIFHENFTYFLEDDENGAKFEAGSQNPEFANYTQQVFDWYDNDDFKQKTQITSAYGLLNGDQPADAYNLWTMPGSPDDTYAENQKQQLRFKASGSADFKDHEISFGFEFEKRTERYFSLGSSTAGEPNIASLWTLARGLTNQHIMERDLNNPEYLWNEAECGNVINYNRLYNQSFQSQFDEGLRTHLGKAIDNTDWINIDELNPSDLSLDYFSADELLNNGSPYVTYYGYDHHGNQTDESSTLDDFFTEKDANGRFTRPIAPFEPIYVAGYIQDKFAFEDLLFSIGVRVDRFDANQKVLKDPYLLHTAYTAGDQDPAGVLSSDRPSNIGDNYIVYVDNISDPTTVNGYRDGSKWYNKEGTLINDPSSIYAATGPAPYLVNPDAEYSPEAFEDYEPQISIMPRISFSFPISDEALFFAHYDILTKRPTSFARLDPVDYLFIQQIGNDYNGISNPNLKPEKTIDYELGFKQKLSNSSALSLSTFYREQRDMVQMVNYTGAYPARTYRTYSNLDFGTVKGFTATYDLRRTSRVQARVSYTLMFANATGSDAGTARALIQARQPNLRTILPTDSDQRHGINVNIDYRFDTYDYTGPKIGTFDVLKGMGFNFTITSASGSPYTKKTDVGFAGNASTITGSINGATKPWRTTVNMKIDRDMLIKINKRQDENGREKFKPIYVNLYLDISNLLNAENILQVYESTGNADDDGFLNSPEGQRAINTYNDDVAFINYYSLAMNRPWYYATPRTIKLGVRFSF